MSPLQPCESSIRRLTLLKIPRSVITVLVCLLIALVLAPPVMAGKGKPGGGGTPSDPPTLPTEPGARFWHSFVNVTDSALTNGRIYLFGGEGGAEDYVVLSDFWSYSVADGWKLLPSGDRSSPGQRAHAGLACSDSDCLLALGRRLGPLDDSWLYSTTSNTWSKISCRRGATCPSARAFVNVAYDERGAAYVLFGGEGENWTSLDDTWVLVGSRWMKKDPSTVPAARDWAAMTYVSDAPSGSTVNQVVMHGGLQRGAGNPFMLGDMYRWNGNNWVEITNTGPTAAPALYSHSMVQRFSPKGELTLIVIGGYTYPPEKPNEDVWQFTFADENTGKWEKIGPLAGLGCNSGDHYAASRMAIDYAANNLIFFGGVENFPYTVAVDNLNVCY